MDDQSLNTWYYKPIDMLVINFAVISENVPDVIRFVDQTGYVFDRMTFGANTSLHEELIRNGFKKVADDDFIKLVGLPEAIKDLGGETQPVYSSGKFWIAWHTAKHLDAYAANYLFDWATVKIMKLPI